MTLTNGEIIEEITMKGSLEKKLAGVALNFIFVQDMNENTILLSKYHIVKAELVHIES